MKRSFLIIVLFTSLGNAQSDLEVLGYNLLFGTLTSGFGSAINKTPEQKWNEAFLEGSWKGALGGSMLYGSKKIVAEVRNEKDWHIAWSSKIVHDIGASFIENGSSNNPLFDQINLNVGFIRNEFRFDSGFNYNVKIKPVSLITTVYSSIGNKFDLSLSLTYGTPLFIRDDNDLPNALGITHVNSIVLRESFANDFGLINHEIIHVFQFDEYAGLNSFMGPQTRKWKRNKAYRKVSDIFYFEFHSVIYYSFYFTDELIQGRPFNFLEQEAYNFADPLRN